MFFVAKICKHVLRASIEGYLVVSASTPTSATLQTNLSVRHSYKNGIIFPMAMSLSLCPCFLVVHLVLLAHLVLENLLVLLVHLVLDYLLVLLVHPGSQPAHYIFVAHCLVCEEKRKNLNQEEFRPHRCGDQEETEKWQPEKMDFEICLK